MDELPAEELVASNPELVILDGVLFEDKYAIAVQKGNKELLNEINTVIEQLKKMEKSKNSLRIIHKDSVK